MVSSCSEEIEAKGQSCCHGGPATLEGERGGVCDAALWLVVHGARGEGEPQEERGRLWNGCLSDSCV